MPAEGLMFRRLFRSRGLTATALTLIKRSRPLGMDGWGSDKSSITDVLSRVARNQRLSFCLLKKVSHQINKCKSVRNAIPASAPGSANRKIRGKRALMPMNIPMPGKSKLLMRNPAERLISLTVRLPLWIRSVGNAVNLLMTILICSHSILVTSG